LSDVENDAKFRTFWPMWKSGDEWTRSLYRLLKLCLRPTLRNTAIHCIAAERGGLMKEKWNEMKCSALEVPRRCAI